ncbi:MAG: hypothetical protein M0P69_12505 [Bacteroidales bacterium]|jgi:hypothetical protein|nr:hypothetical protein [Bacteroidales bacterium]
MSVDLSQLILEVRSALTEVPEDYIGDHQIYKDLKRAYRFIIAIAKEDAEEDLIQLATINLGAYYSYLNYTGMAERILETLPQTSYLRVGTFREIALSTLQLISTVPLKSDLTIDTKALSGCLPGVGLTSSTVDSEE